MQYSWLGFGGGVGRLVRDNIHTPAGDIRRISNVVRAFRKLLRSMNRLDNDDHNGEPHQARLCQSTFHLNPVW